MQQKTMIGGCLILLAAIPTGGLTLTGPGAGISPGHHGERPWLKP